MKELKYSCPSSVCHEDAMILGKVTNDGVVEIYDHPVAVTEELIQSLPEDTTPEKQYRFSGKCVESGCHQWNKGKCGVIDKIYKMNEAVLKTFEAPDIQCYLTPTCRWFHQIGSEACKVCPYIVTDNV